jgi:hypothetical protein
MLFHADNDAHVRAVGVLDPSEQSFPPRTVHRQLTVQHQTNSSMPLQRLVDFFSSLKLTVVCLTLGLVLVFLGTLAQVDLGLYKAQNEYFRSFMIYWGPKSATWKIPVFPGGYLIGGVLLINLIAAHFERFHWTRKKVGIWMAHVGIILLLVGQLLTDLLARETGLHLRMGETKNYSETERQAELVIIDATAPDSDTIYSIPQSRLAHGVEIAQSGLPFTIRVRDFYANSEVENRPPDSVAPPAATQNIGTRAIVRELPRVTETDKRDVPSAVVELMSEKGSLGSWLATEYIDEPQTFMFKDRTFRIAMRPRRFYEPYSIKLMEFKHDVYPGTEIPKNFSSRVRVERPDTGEKREVLIYMNNPLRYAGSTYYQASFDRDDKGTVLQVVRNPSWLTPYFSCLLVGAGLMVQFLIHLVSFTRKQKVA